MGNSIEKYVSSTTWVGLSMVLGLISLIIAGSQFSAGQILWGTLSLVYTTAFWTGGIMSSMHKGFIAKQQKWALGRIVLFAIIGVFNTSLIRPEDVGSWKNYIGYVFLAAALIEILRLFIQQKRRQ